MTEMLTIDIVLELLALLMTGLLSGTLLSLTILIFISSRYFPKAELIRTGAPLYFWLCSILSLIAAFSSALTGHGVAGFMLGIIAMSLVLGRIHLLRLAISSLDEGQLGDQGAMRMYRLNIGLLAVLLLCLIMASLWVLALLACSS